MLTPTRSPIIVMRSAADLGRRIGYITDSHFINADGVTRGFCYCPLTTRDEHSPKARPVSSSQVLRAPHLFPANILACAPELRPRLLAIR